MFFFTTIFLCTVSQDNRCSLITLTKHLKKLAMLDVLILGIVVVVLSGSVYKKQGKAACLKMGIFLNGIKLPCIVMGNMMINYPISDILCSDKPMYGLFMYVYVYRIFMLFMLPTVV